MRVLVIGASGTGTSTLGRALAADLGCTWIDADDMFWLPTEPPFTTKRPRDERLAMILDALSAGGVVSGSIVGWGGALEDSFDLIVFVTLDTAARLERLRARELERFGHVNETFLAWAARYDDDDLAEGRSRKLHEAWLADRPNVMRLDGAVSTRDQVSVVRARLQRTTSTVTVE